MYYIACLFIYRVLKRVQLEQPDAVTSQKQLASEWVMLHSVSLDSMTTKSIQFGFVAKLDNF